jgi:hypothetical protein
MSKLTVKKCGGLFDCEEEALEEHLVPYESRDSQSDVPVLQQIGAAPACLQPFF